MALGAVGANAAVQTYTQSQASAPPPAVAAYEARNTAAVGVTQTENAARAATNTNKNQETREVRQEYRKEHTPPKAASVGPRGQNVDISV